LLLLQKVLKYLTLDATIKIWDIPQEGLTENLTKETQTLSGHSKKVSLLNWHPTVFELLASGGFDNKVNIWNILTGEALHAFTFADSLMSLEWNAIGSQLALTTKDKNVSIVDPRINKSDVNFKGHDSAKNSKVCWITQEQLITTGYGKQNDRQIKLWDLKNTSKEVQTVSVDTQSGPIQPFYDADTGLIFVPGRGEGNIRYYEYASGSVKSISEYKAQTSQKSVCFFPKRTMNYNKCEVARIGKLTNTTLEYVSFYIPKRVEGFHAEMYPDVISGELNTTVEEWKAGSNKEPTRKAINTLENKWKISESSFESRASTSTDPQQQTDSHKDQSGEVEALKNRVNQLELTVESLKQELENALQENTALKQEIEASHQPTNQEEQPPQEQN
jgi:hypothetical protein